MHKYRKFKIILIFIIVGIFLNISKININANTNENINFKNISIRDGLSQSTAEVIFQDSRGYIWIGTADGLNRYDGYDFKMYKYSADSQNSLTSNSIVDINEDRYGNIWVGTPTGLNKINMSTGNITNYTQGGNFYITQILITNDNKIVVGTTDGLNIYDEKNDKFIRVLGEENDLTSQFIYSLDVDNEGNIWIGTTDGLDKISKDFKKIKQYKNNEENSICDSSVYNILYNQGYIWIGTSNSGLIKLDIKNDTTKQYKNNIKDDKSICNNYIRALFIDSNNVLWVGTDNGLAKYNEIEDNFFIYKNSTYDQNSLSSNTVLSIIEDNSGLIWVGTESGVSIFDSTNKIEYYKSEPFNENSLKSNFIYGIYEDKNGILWVGSSSDGISLINRENGTVNHINEDEDIYGLSNYSINEIIGDDKFVYIATNEGLNIVDIETKKCKIFLKEDGLQSNAITSLFLDNKGYLWIGSNEGLNILNTKNYEIINLSEIIKKDSDTNKYVKTIYQDKEGDYYIGFFRNGGMMKIDPINKTTKLYLNNKEDKNSISNNYVRTIIEDDDNNLWIGTSYGLNKFDKSTEKFYTYTTKDGLANDTVYEILMDNNNKLWMSTNGGLSKFDTENEVFRNFGITDGLQGNEFNGNAAYKNENGELFFGGINGLNIFNPEQIDSSKVSPSVVFSECYVSNQEFMNLNNKQFNSDDNTIKFGFFVPVYENISKITYYYKLDGNDSEWNSTTDNHITYHELKPGNYKFRIIARYSNGKYSEENSIDFQIKRPFWASDLAIIIYIILICMLIYNNKNKMKRLDRLVDKRTKQLKSEMDKNNNLLNKIIKLERNKNNYFVNLSHELRTPLNVINSTNQLIEDFNKNDIPINKEKLSYYMEISNRNCKRLLNLINNIIDSTKLQNDSYVINLKENDIVYIVEEATLSLIEFAKQRGIEIIVEPYIEEKIIQCDAYEIERCIVNLVSNAIKFTHSGGTIEVTIKEIDDAVIISVKDDGIGIDKENVEFIFDRFNQVIDLNNEIKGGSGLGLTITKQIIELHKGSIRVESEIGKGSNFIITLPLTNQ